MFGNIQSFIYFSTEIIFQDVYLYFHSTSNSHPVLVLLFFNYLEKLVSQVKILLSLPVSKYCIKYVQLVILILHVIIQDSLSLWYKSMCLHSYQYIERHTLLCLLQVNLYILPLYIHHFPFSASLLHKFIRRHHLLII